MKTFELNNKELIPAVGFGVFLIHVFYIYLNSLQ